jgi:hypothetical protein
VTREMSRPRASAAAEHSAVIMHRAVAPAGSGPTRMSASDKHRKGEFIVWVRPCHWLRFRAATSHRRFLDSRSFRDPCIGDKDVQVISDDAACLLGKLAGAVSGGEVRRYGICAATGFVYSVLYGRSRGIGKCGMISN